VDYKGEKSEKRRMERFTIELPAKVSVLDKKRDNKTIDFLTSNICAGGVFFQTDQPLPVGTEAKINLILPLDTLKKLKGRKACIRLSGTVIRSERGGMAIRFEEDFEISPSQDRETIP